MSSPRLAAVVLIVSSCASWDSAAPTYAAPPSASPAPSHYAPPPEAPPPEPVVIAEPPRSELPTDVPPQDPPHVPPPRAPVTDRHAAIASVQLLEDCPEAAAPASASARGPAGSVAGESKSASWSSSSPEGRPECEQSTVQLAVRSNLAGAFRIDAVRVLDATTGRKVGKTTLRLPTRWDEATGIYNAWDATLTAGADLNISYKLGDLDVSLDTRGGPDFNAIMGPFKLELDVTIAGKRSKIRSPEFGREPVRMGNIQT